MRLGPVPAGLHLVLEDVVDRSHHADEEGVLAAHGGHRRPPCLDVDGLLDDVVEVEGHVVEDVAEALRHEPQVGGLPPDEQVQRRVEEVHADVVAGGGAGAAAAAAAAGHAEVALLAEVGAPGGVVLEELPADAAGDGEVEDVDGVVLGESRRGAELRVGEEEHQVLPLVPDVVRLEPEGGAEPVEDVGAVRVPDAGQRRRREVRRVRQRLHRRPHFRHLQRRVVPVHHHVLDRDDVVRRLHHRLLPRTRRRRGAAVPQQAHLPVSRSQRMGWPPPPPPPRRLSLAQLLLDLFLKPGRNCRRIEMPLLSFRSSLLGLPGVSAFEMVSPWRWSTDTTLLFFLARPRSGS